MGSFYLSTFLVGFANGFSNKYFLTFVPESRYNQTIDTLLKRGFIESDGFGYRCTKRGMEIVKQIENSLNSSL